MSGGGAFPVAHTGALPVLPLPTLPFELATLPALPFELATIPRTAEPNFAHDQLSQNSLTTTYITTPRDHPQPPLHLHRTYSALRMYHFREQENGMIEVNG